MSLKFYHYRSKDGKTALHLWISYGRSFEHLSLSSTCTESRENVCLLSLTDIPTTNIPKRLGRTCSIAPFSTLRPIVMILTLTHFWSPGDLLLDGITDVNPMHWSRKNEWHCIIPLITPCAGWGNFSQLSRKTGFGWSVPCWSVTVPQANSDLHLDIKYFSYLWVVITGCFGCLSHSENNSSSFYLILLGWWDHDRRPGICSSDCLASLTMTSSFDRPWLGWSFVFVQWVCFAFVFPQDTNTRQCAQLSVNEGQNSKLSFCLCNRMLINWPLSAWMECYRAIREL